MSLYGLLMSLYGLLMARNSVMAFQRRPGSGLLRPYGVS
jgi:hypothetical protein